MLQYNAQTKDRSLPSTVEGYFAYSSDFSSPLHSSNPFFQLNNREDNRSELVFTRSDLKECVENVIKDCDKLKSKYFLLGEYAHAFIPTLDELIAQLNQNSSEKYREMINTFNIFYETFNSYLKAIQPMEDKITVLQNTLKSSAKSNHPDFLANLEDKIKMDNIIFFHKKIKEETQSITLAVEALAKYSETNKHVESLENRENVEEQRRKLYSHLCNMRVTIQDIQKQPVLLSLAQQNDLKRLLKHADKMCKQLEQEVPDLASEMRLLENEKLDAINEWLNRVKLSQSSNSSFNR